MFMNRLRAWVAATGVLPAVCVITENAAPMSAAAILAMRAVDARSPTTGTSSWTDVLP